MHLPPFCAIGVIATLLVIASATYANPLTPFRYEFQAQRHCPSDAVVWLDFRKRIYYSHAQRHYARGLDGSFVCRDEALRSGYRRSLLGLREPLHSLDRATWSRWATRINQERYAF